MTAYSEGREYDGKCYRQCRKRGPIIMEHYYGVGSYGISDESSSRHWSYWSLYRESLSEKDLLSFAWMIADGMDYLASMKVWS